MRRSDGLLTFSQFASLPIEALRAPLRTPRAMLGPVAGMGMNYEGRCSIAQRRHRTLSMQCRGQARCGNKYTQDVSVYYRDAIRFSPVGRRRSCAGSRSLLTDGRLAGDGENDTSLCRGISESSDDTHSAILLGLDGRDISPCLHGRASVQHCTM